ncbi:hypothetical protein PY254_17820 [Rhodanobacter sp. AS-Z3]|uniref:hypothetical protein n=1 Tax=Rhodanobacter sp. AS-Z3 TaxID=3031330 RepID=UPI00247AE883|nr:hypothetical protein [Rhodanobacter sp. AS-Z3]WEN15061.1 hypothetical protein PY254_17820 [Rhodanobacter sp. AS-Z3]
MWLHEQWLLMVAIACLYLYDSALLLFHNELVLEARASGYVVSGGSAIELGGRHVFLPNPCCPHRALARLSWPHGGSAEWRPERWRRARLAVSVIAPWTWWLLGLFFVALPLALCFAADIVLLGWLLLTYLSIIAMLAQVWRYRQALGLTPRAVGALAADALLCAPFALNIVRKISLRQAAAAPLHAFAASMLSSAERVALAGLLRERIHISLDHLEPASESSATLLAYLDQYQDDIP